MTEATEAEVIPLPPGMQKFEVQPDGPNGWRIVENRVFQAGSKKVGEVYSTPRWYFGAFEKAIEYLYRISSADAASYLPLKEAFEHGLNEVRLALKGFKNA